MGPINNLTSQVSGVTAVSGCSGGLGAGPVGEERVGGRLSNSGWHGDWGDSSATSMRRTPTADHTHPAPTRLTLNASLAHHLSLLALEVGRAVDEVTDTGVVVECLEELLRLHVVADLGEFWCQRGLQRAFCPSSDVKLIRLNSTWKCGSLPHHQAVLDACVTASVLGAARLAGTHGKKQRRGHTSTG